MATNRATRTLAEKALRSGAFLGGCWWLMCVSYLLASQSSAVSISWMTLGLIVVSLSLGLVTFALFAYDKRQAELAGWRVQEFTLQMFTLLGGWSGSFLAQRWLRHKSQKPSFQIAAWLGFALHLLAAMAWWTWK
jgi:uncharacterized membrane protein YsdA (DUF1294 family)